MAGVPDRDNNIRKGVNIEIVSISWMVVEAVTGIGAGIAAHSLALVAFGADSVIELVAGLTLLWRLSLEMNGGRPERVRRAEKTASYVVGIALLVLAVYVVAAAVYDLASRSAAKVSPVGIGLALAALLLMSYLAKAKKKTGREIGSTALQADGSCSIVCAYMALVLLLGMSLTALFGWWWIDSVASLGLVYFVSREGLEAVNAARNNKDT